MPLECSTVGIRQDVTVMANCENVLVGTRWHIQCSCRPNTSTLWWWLVVVDRDGCYICPSKPGGPVNAIASYRWLSRQNEIMLFTIIIICKCWFPNLSRVEQWYCSHYQDIDLLSLCTHHQVKDNLFHLVSAESFLLAFGCLAGFNQRARAESHSCYT